MTKTEEEGGNTKRRPRSSNLLFRRLHALPCIPRRYSLFDFTGTWTACLVDKRRSVSSISRRRGISLSGEKWSTGQTYNLSYKRSPLFTTRGYDETRTTKRLRTRDETPGGTGEGHGRTLHAHKESHDFILTTSFTLNPVCSVLFSFFLHPDSLKVYGPSFRETKQVEAFFDRKKGGKGGNFYSVSRLRKGMF